MSTRGLDVSKPYGVPSLTLTEPSPPAVEPRSRTRRPWLSRSSVTVTSATYWPTPDTAGPTSGRSRHGFSDRSAEASGVTAVAYRTSRDTYPRPRSSVMISGSPASQLSTLICQSARVATTVSVAGTPPTGPVWSMVKYAVSPGSRGTETTSGPSGAVSAAYVVAVPRHGSTLWTRPERCRAMRATVGAPVSYRKW